MQKFTCIYVGWGASGDYELIAALVPLALSEICTMAVEYAKSVNWLYQPKDFVLCLGRRYIFFEISERSYPPEFYGEMAGDTIDFENLEHAFSADEITLIKAAIKKHEGEQLDIYRAKLKLAEEQKRAKAQEEEIALLKQLRAKYPLV